MPARDFDDIPFALEPHRPFGGVDEDIPLFEGAFLVAERDASVEFDGRIEYRWRPRPGVHFEGVREPFLPTDGPLTGREWERISVPSLGVTVTIDPGPNFESSVGGGSSSATILGKITSVDVGGATTLSSGSFLLSNFPRLRGSRIRSGTKIWAGRVHLVGSGWEVFLDARSDLSKVAKELQRSGRHAVTHVGRIRRSDGLLFSARQFTDVVEALLWLLSFAAGRWTPPILLAGQDDRNEVVWERWHSPRVDPWLGRFSWCDHNDWGALAKAFTGWMDLWPDPFWHEVLRLSVGRFLSVNRPDPVEEAISAAQSGLELLGWARLVQDQGAYRPRQWRDLPADEKVKALLDVANIAHAVPTELEALDRLARSENWGSGPEALTHVRNRLIHPRRRDGQFGWPHDVLVESWLLSSLYLELSLLHLLRAEGGYRCRLQSGGYSGPTTPFPWSPF